MVSITDPPRMDNDRHHMAAMILDLALEIIHLITGEDYTVVKKASGEWVTPHVSGGRSSIQSPITESPPHSLIQKVLELTSRMTELLTGEVPIRCQDVAVYFSMEEWKYLEGHKDLYKDVMMEEHQPLTSPDGSSRENPPERCPSPLCSQDCPEEEPNPQIDCQVLHMGFLQERYEATTNRLENPISVSVNGENFMRDFHGHPPLSPSYETEDNPSQIDETRTGDERTDVNEKPFSCSECGKCFSYKSRLVEHQKLHKGEKPFSCLECGKYFTTKSHLVAHRRTHTGEKPFSCSECGRCFSRRSNLGEHLKTHTEEKPFSCSECGKCFSNKANLVRHLRTHTGEKTFSCTVCGKYFSHNFDLVQHQRIHTGEKPFSCSKCGKCFNRRSNLGEHLKTHVKKPFSCSECGKFFGNQLKLVKHQKIHTRERRFSCSECGKCFGKKLVFLQHQRSHQERSRFHAQDVEDVLVKDEILVNL